MGMRSERVFTALIGVVSLVLLVGMVVTIEGGLLEYPGAVVRLALLCASLLLLALMFRRDAIRLGQNAMPSVAFSIVALLSVAVSPGFTSALMRLELYYAIIVAGLSVGFALRHCSQSAGKIILLAISIVHAGFLLIAVQFAMVAAGDADPLAAPPYFLNVRHLGYQGFFGASAAVAVALADRRLRSAGILLGTAAVFGIIMFGSRGALLAWLLFVVAAIAWVPDRRAAVEVNLLVIVGALALSAVAERHDWMNTWSLLDRALSPIDGSIPMLYVHDRIEIWLDSLATIAQKPLLGFGPNGYVISGCCNRNVAQPHNSVLQLLLEFGIVGFVTLTWAAMRMVGPRVRNIVLRTARLDRDPVQAAALAIVVGYAGFSLIDGLLYFPVPLINFALVCAVLAAAPPGQSDPTRGPADTVTLSPASSPGT